MGAFHVFLNFLGAKLKFFLKSGGGRTYVSKKYGCYSTKCTKLTRAKIITKGATLGLVPLVPVNPWISRNYSKKHSKF